MITSRTNERIKAVRALQQHKERERTGLHLIEGDKLVFDAYASGAALETVFALEGENVPQGVETVTVSESVMEAIRTQPAPQGICAVGKTPSCACPDSYPSGLIVALDRLQDPGNLGTILRTADALGASGVLLSRDTTDPFSPKALRAAMGSTYHLPVWIGDLETELVRLLQTGYACICGHLGGSASLPPHGERTVLVVGHEGNGVSDAVARLCSRSRMPMKGRADSLNAAVFAALMMQKLLEN